MPVDTNLGPVASPLAVRITVIPNWPQVEDGTRQIQVPRHPVVVWLFARLNRWFGLKLRTANTVRVPKYRDADVVFDRDSGIIYCSPAQYDSLRKVLLKDAA